MAEEPSNSSDKPQKKARTTGTGTGGWLPDWMPFGKAVPRTERPVVSTEEVFALLKYAAETGVEDECLAALTEEIHQSEPSHS